MAGIVQIIGSDVLLNEEKVSTESFAEEGKVIGLCFSAHWCPPCRGFTPQLTKWYTDFKKTEKGNSLEIVFVSSDRDETSFKNYYAEMPWHALPFENREKKVNAYFHASLMTLASALPSLQRLLPEARVHHDTFVFS